MFPHRCGFDGHNDSCLFVPRMGFPGLCISHVNHNQKCAVTRPKAHTLIDSALLMPFICVVSRATLKCLLPLALPSGSLVFGSEKSLSRQLQTRPGRWNICASAFLSEGWPGDPREAAILGSPGRPWFVLVPNGAKCALRTAFAGLLASARVRTTSFELHPGGQSLRK